MAAAKGAGLPSHVDPQDWETLKVDQFEAAALDGDEIVEERDFFIDGNFSDASSRWVGSAQQASS